MFSTLSSATGAGVVARYLWVAVVLPACTRVSLRLNDLTTICRPVNTGPQQGSLGSSHTLHISLHMLTRCDDY